MTNRNRASERSTRGKLHSPGRPRAALRTQQVMFWQLIKQGVSSEEAGVQAGASAPVGSRWFREAGGMPPSKFANASQPLSGRYLCFAEREEVALYRAQGFGVCAIARKIGRSASTVSRELRRNAATRSGGFEYRATTAQWHADRAARRFGLGSSRAGFGSTTIAANIGSSAVSGGRASAPAISFLRQSYTCQRVTACRRATSATFIPGTLLSAAIRARTASLRRRRPDRPSKTSILPAQPYVEPSKETSILPSYPVSLRQ